MLLYLLLRNLINELIKKNSLFLNENISKIKYSEEIKNQVVYKNVSEELKIYACDYRDLERRYNNSQNTIEKLEEKSNNLEQKN